MHINIASAAHCFLKYCSVLCNLYLCFLLTSCVYFFVWSIFAWVLVFRSSICESRLCLPYWNHTFVSTKTSTVIKQVLISKHIWKGESRKLKENKSHPPHPKNHRWLSVSLVPLVPLQHLQQFFAVRIGQCSSIHNHVKILFQVLSLH